MPNSLVSFDDIDPGGSFPARQGHGHFPRHPERAAEGERCAPAVRRGARQRCARDAGRAAEAVRELRDRRQRDPENMQRLVLAKQAARGINQESEPLLSDTTSLTQRIRRPDDGAKLDPLGRDDVRLAGPYCADRIRLGVARGRTRARLRKRAENKRNQEAILRLLNEMGNLADGDLTVQASVTEDVTGAIADSMTPRSRSPHAGPRHQFGDRPGGQGDADAQAISNRLYEASQRQNKEIQQASASVLQMAQSISEVSQTAAPPATPSGSARSALPRRRPPAPG